MNKYNKDNVAEAVAKSYSWAGVCRLLGTKPNTGSQSYIKATAVKFGVDFSHFTGQSWSRGRKYTPKVNLDAMLVRGSNVNSHRLKLYLIRAGLKVSECERCGISEWLGEEIPLDLDHINADNKDNRLDNLQILCPNCHRQKTRKDRSNRGQLKIF